MSLSNTKQYLVLVLALCTCACANPKKISTEDSWPQNIPALAHYQGLYSDDTYNQAVQSQDDYLLWVVRFYKGWSGFTRGWLDVSEDLIDGVESDRQAIVKQKLVAMGKQVSGEWAKKSDQRLIYTKTLSIWGDALNEAIYAGQIEPVIDSITTDVAAMLSRQLHADAISLQRYFPNLDMNQEFSMF